MAAAVSWPAWTVIVEQSADEAFALSNQLELQLGIVIAVALVATIGFGYYWAWSFIRPIHALKGGTDAIASGRLDERVDIGGADELHRLGQSFNTMADKLDELQEDVRRQERQAMLDRIAAGLVHDLSHPIQNIGNSCRLIVKLFDDEEYRTTFRRTVDREFTSIKRVLENLRNLARPMPLERFPIDINRSIAEVAKSMHPLAETAGLGLDVRLSTERLFIESDNFALGRVYRNLVLNSIEATATGCACWSATPAPASRRRAWRTFSRTSTRPSVGDSVSVWPFHARSSTSLAARSRSRVAPATAPRSRSSSLESSNRTPRPRRRGADHRRRRATMFQTLIKKTQLDVESTTVNASYYETRTVKGPSQFCAEVEFGTEDHMILDADSVSGLETKLSSLVRASVYSRMPVGASAAAA